MDQVNVKATFRDDDLFARKQYAKIGMKLIENHPKEKGACTIAIDAPWGVGKSTFLHMWINELDLGNTLMYPNPIYRSEFKGKNVLPIYYNAWENDFSDSAMVPLLYTICAQLDKKHEDGWLLPDDENAIVEFLSSCSSLLLMLLTYVVSKDEVTAQAAGAAGGLTIKGLLNLLARYVKHKDDEPEPDSIGAAYDKQLEIRENFRNALVELTKKCGGVYVFIDELDRCKPTFAIDTLEMIKHYFDIPGLVFVFGVDITQLSYAISGRYGENFDAIGYLSKFFDHHILLPTPSAKQMIQYCMPSASLLSDSYRHMDEIFAACKVTPREIPRIMKTSHTLLTLVFSNVWYGARDQAREFIILLVSLRYRQTEIYQRYIGNVAGWNIYQWNQNHDFYELLSFFEPYMTMTADVCSKEWRSILQEEPDASRNDALSIECSAIGRAILECVQHYGGDTFGQCIAAFLELAHLY